MILSISTGRLKNSLTFALKSEILSSSLILGYPQTTSSTASSIYSPKSPKISRIAHRALVEVTPLA